MRSQDNRTTIVFVARHGQRRLLLIAVLCLAMQLALPPGLRASGGAYRLGWWTLASSGQSSSDSYALSGSLGQLDATTDPASSPGDYTLQGGFWTCADLNSCTGEPPSDQRTVYLPFVAR